MAFYESKHDSFLVFTLFITTLISSGSGKTSVNFNPDTVTFEIGQFQDVTLKLSESLNHSATLRFTYQLGGSRPKYSEPKDSRIVKEIPDVTLTENQTFTTVRVTGIHTGSIIVGVNSFDDQFVDLDEAFVRVRVVHSEPVEIVSAVFGWIYFVAWTVSFYPQVFYNWSQKSVVGLNFDYLAYNLIGFIAYGLFNFGMYRIDDVKEEYQAKYPQGVISVQLNDVVYALHAVVLTAFTAGQCIIYERGGQRVSRGCVILLAGTCLFSVVMLFVSVGKVITWLTYLYYFSYIKLCVTFIKCIPQAMMNFRRKSTEGWSIGNVLLDLTGGIFSVLQMFLIAYNHGDSSSIFGNIPKIGLGVFSMMFSVLFIVQHYYLYRRTSGNAKTDNMINEYFMKNINTLYFKINSIK